ncbi:MAG: NifB/NifX family molybdenum-iron cluster-binding protein [Planctomycetes bacterium]|nr:NifB/NifX family molybdenum-iron cluster-binding protein [Planctomycetota bacterium]
MFMVLIAATLLLTGRSLYEAAYPGFKQGDQARFVAICSTGADIQSPVSYLFGRAPWFIICDRMNQTFRSVMNPYVEAPHAAGLKSAQLLTTYNIDAVVGNNVGFEPARVFQQDNIDIYSGVKNTVWETLLAYPDGLTGLKGENVPAHFGITGSKAQVPCTSFEARANIKNIVQGSYLICEKCQYREALDSTSQSPPNSRCPLCNAKVFKVISVAAPPQVNGVDPKIKVL